MLRLEGVGGFAYRLLIFSFWLQSCVGHEKYNWKVDIDKFVTS